MIKMYMFILNVDEPCDYKRIQDQKVIFLILYVDDILLIWNDVGELTLLNVQLVKQFQMKDLE